MSHSFLTRRIPRLLATFALLLLVASFGFAQHYQQNNLVSDIPGLAAITDPNLVNAWGITRSGGSPWWVNAAGTGLSLVYNGSGQPFPPANPLIVSVPPPGSEPTGIAFNGSTDFQVAAGAPAVFLFATTNGVLSGWNPTVNLGTAITVVDNSDTAVYTGLTIAQSQGRNQLYAANFKEHQVEVYDATFQRVALSSSAFRDPWLPSRYGPFNVQAIGGLIAVTFAVEDDGDEVAGRGLGAVDIFSAEGQLLVRLKRGPWLNAPWGVAMAPQGFGKFSGDLLIGNFGSGQIAAYKVKSGTFHGLLRDSWGKPLNIEGLWGLGFGNGANAGPNTTLFFAAGPDDEAHGLFGTITPAH